MDVLSIIWDSANALLSPIYSNPRGEHERSLEGETKGVWLTVCALHLPIVARLYEADVPQVEDTCSDLQHLSLDVTWDADHLHGLLET